jgi:hypothetical protein
MKKQKKSEKKFTVGYLVRMWVEREIEADNFEEALVVGASLNIPSFFTMKPGTQVNDAYIDLVQVYDVDGLGKLDS